MTDYDIGRAFAEIEDELISSMINNLKHHKAEEKKEGYRWSQWQAEQLKALEVYKARNKNKFSDSFFQINSNIEKVIKEAYKEGGMKQELKILEAIKKGYKPPVVKKSSNIRTTGEFFKVNEHKLNSLVEATTHDMKKAEQAVLRRVNDQYRKIIFNAQVYANAGGNTYEKAVDMATRDFLRAGIDCIEYSNGARHTISDYADMAIKTATKRAYLRGEGTKRAEWGIHTVITNKRGNPCPLCLPWVGKVLIDDVYSGGTIEESRKTGYPLVSSAIEQGFLHPRCKDAYSTYFEDISTPPQQEQVTEQEEQEIKNNNQLEHKQQYHIRMAEKCHRIGNYSLDNDNKKIHLSRAEEHMKIADEMGGKITLESVENSAESGIIRDKINRAKTIDIFNDNNLKIGDITSQDVIGELSKSSVGQDTLKILSDMQEPPILTYGSNPNIRGEERGGNINIYVNNCKNIQWIARTVIHECTHYYYGIGNCQWAECVCIAQELKHARGRNYLTISEKRMIIKAVKSDEDYKKLNWRKGGYINGRRKSNR